MLIFWPHTLLIFTSFQLRPHWGGKFELFSWEHIHQTIWGGQVPRKKIGGSRIQTQDLSVTRWPCLPKHLPQSNGPRSMYWWKMVLQVFSSLQFFDIFVEEWSQTTNRSENSRLIMFENELNFDLSRAHIGSQKFSAKWAKLKQWAPQSRLCVGLAAAAAALVVFRSYFYS